MITFKCFGPSGESCKRFERKFCGMFIGLSLLFLFLIPIVNAQPADPYSKLSARYLAIVNKLLYADAQNLPREIAAIRPIIQLDPTLAKNIVSPKSNLSADVVRIGGCDFSQEEKLLVDYVAVAFKEGKICISGKIVGSPASHVYFYLTFIKAFNALPEKLRSQPNVITRGICALIAQEVAHPSTLTLLPRFFHEAALANLLYLSDPELILLPFRPGFNQNRFRGRVRAALARFASVPSHEFDQLFSNTSRFEIDSVVKYSTGEQLGQLIGSIDNDIGSLTVRFMLIKTMLDAGKFHTVAGESGLDVYLNTLKDDALRAFRRELGKRYGFSPNARLRDLRFEKNAFAWLFQILYNTSPMIQDSIKARGLNTVKFDGDYEGVYEQHIVPLMSRDPYTGELIALLGVPKIELRRNTKDTRVLGLEWAIERKALGGRRDREFINVEFFGKRVAVSPTLTEGQHSGSGSGSSGLDGISGRDSSGVSAGDGGDSDDGTPRGGGRIGGGGNRQGLSLGSDLGKNKGSDRGKNNDVKPDSILKINAAALNSLQAPEYWSERVINLSKEDLAAIHALDVSHLKVPGLPASLAGLSKAKKEEIARFFSLFIKRNPSLFRYLNAATIEKHWQLTFLPLIDHVAASYVAQRDSFLTRPNIQTLKHLSHKFMFLYYLTAVFDKAQKTQTLEQDMLEMVVRTLFSGQGSNDGIGYQYFADLKSSLGHLLRFMQDVKYFYVHDRATPHSEVKSGISSALAHYLNGEIPRVNRSIPSGDQHIAAREIVTAGGLNIRDLISQLDKAKYEIQNPHWQQPEEIRDMVSCRDTGSTIYSHLLFADSHVITETGSVEDSFSACFGKYFDILPVTEVRAPVASSN